MIKKRFILLALVTSQACALPVSDVGQVARATVVEVSPKPRVVAGYVGAWIRVIAESSQHGSRKNLYLLYNSENRLVPRQGQACDFHYHSGTVSGWIGEKTGHEDNVSVVDSFTCDHSPK